MSGIDPTATFRQEAAELLEQFEQALLDLGSNPSDRDLIDSAFRAMHTIKGNSRLVGLKVVERSAHAVEETLERIRELTPYFLGVLSRVNRGRVAKARVFRFLTDEADKSPEAATLVAELMTRQSLTMAIGDKAASIVAMVKVREHFGDIDMPIAIKQPPVRTKEARSGV